MREPSFTGKDDMSGIENGFGQTHSHFLYTNMSSQYSALVDSLADKIDIFSMSLNVIDSQIDVTSADFKESHAHMLGLVTAYKDRLTNVRGGGGADSVKKHKARGKLTARERIALLVDESSAFLEFSALAGWEMYEGACPGGGIVTGIGQIHGQECVIVANDATVKGGTYFPITVKKHLRAQEVALENGLPCIYLVDSGGAFLPMQSEVFPDRDHFGRIFYNQARMSALGISQISVVMGSCTAGGAYIPAMSDENVIVKGNGTIFLGGPPLVKAATGEDVDAESLGGGLVHSKISGVTDHLADNDPHALEITRNIVYHLNRKKNLPFNIAAIQEPAYDPKEIYGVIPHDPRKSYDVHEIIARLVDGSMFHEFKALYGTTIVCGFAHIMGFPVGIIANNGVLFSESSLKTTHFIELCGQRKIPLVFLQNITGFMVGKKYENEGLAKDGAKMVMAVSNVPVPRFTVVIGNSYGAGNYGMCGRAFQPRQLWMWPNSKIAVMGGEQASNVLLTVKIEQMAKDGKKMTAEEQLAFRAPTLKKYEHESSAYFSTARLWDDGIIDPVDTRRVLAMGIASSTNREWEPNRQGVFRM